MDERVARVLGGGGDAHLLHAVVVISLTTLEGRAFHGLQRAMQIRVTCCL